MSVRIDYFFSCVSPYAYFGHQAFLDMAARQGADIAFKPVKMGAIFDGTGGVPMPQRHPARLAYRWIELQRWRDARGLAFNPRPKFWPVDPSLADRSVLAVMASGANPGVYIGKVLAALWAEEANVNDADTLCALLESCGYNGAALLGEVHAGVHDSAYGANTEEGVELQIIGSPCYVLNGEPFWGQDRIELLEAAIVSGRAPYKPL